MTGYTVHTGSSVKFSSGWDAVFSGGKVARKSAGKRTVSNVTSATPAKKKAVKKGAAKSVAAPKKKVAVLKKKTDVKQKLANSVKRGK